MHNTGFYRSTDSMSELITRNYRILLTMSRFGIPLGVRDNSIGEICQSVGVDVDTFLSVVNLLNSPNLPLSEHSIEAVSIESLLGYLRRSHDYFLNFRLPQIRERLSDALHDDARTLTQAVLRYFDEYVSEVRRHMMYEEQTVFPYVESILHGTLDKKFSIDVFSRHHGNIDDRLSELKDILIRYYQAQDINRINSVLFDIFSCAEDLAFHNRVEDTLFTPAVREREAALRSGNLRHRERASL